MKYWSCCGVKTMDFSAFLEQPGCSSGRHCWTGNGVRELSAGSTHVRKVSLLAPKECSFLCSAFTGFSAFNYLNFHNCQQMTV